MLSKDGKRLKLPGLDGMLGVPKEETATEIDIWKIQGFRNHPFKVQDDEKMRELVESIRLNGVLTPVLLRPIDTDKYEMISGHRRMHAANILKMEMIPAFIREMSDEEAIVHMVDSNIQREELLPSEKAFAYKMKLCAMKRQAGRRPKNNSGQNDQNKTGTSSRDLMAGQIGESSKQIQRYIRLTELIPQLLELVDKKTLNFGAGVEISYIDKEIQNWIYQYIRANGSITPNQIKDLRTALSGGAMTQFKMNAILNGVTKTKPSPKKMTISEKKLRNYLGNELTVEEMESIVFTLLEEYKKSHSAVS